MKEWRKLVCLNLVMIILLSLLPISIVAAAIEQLKSEHSCQWMPWEVTIVPSLDKTGEIKRICCVQGCEYTKTIPKLNCIEYRMERNHDQDNGVWFDFTYGIDGQSFCFRVQGDTWKWDSWAVVQAPTVYSTGWLIRYCINNRALFEKEEIPSLSPENGYVLQTQVENGITFTNYFYAKDGQAFLFQIQQPPVSGSALCFPWEITKENELLLGDGVGTRDYLQTMASNGSLRMYATGTDLQTCAESATFQTNIVGVDVECSSEKADFTIVASSCALQVFENETELRIFASSSGIQIITNGSQMKVIGSGTDIVVYGTAANLQIYATDGDMSVFATGKKSDFIASSQNLKIIGSSQDLRIFASHGSLQLNISRPEICVYGTCMDLRLNNSDTNYTVNYYNRRMYVYSKSTEVEVYASGSDLQIYASGTMMQVFGSRPSLQVYANGAELQYWDEYREYIKYVRVLPNVDSNGNARNVFQNIRHVESVDLQYLDTSRETDLSGMFADMVNLKSLDLRNMDTRNVICADDMFLNCGAVFIYYDPQLWGEAVHQAAKDAGYTKIEEGIYSRYEDSILLSAENDEDGAISVCIENVTGKNVSGSLIYAAYNNDGKCLATEIVFVNIQSNQKTTFAEDFFGGLSDLVVVKTFFVDEDMIPLSKCVSIDLTRE